MLLHLNCSENIWLNHFLLNFTVRKFSIQPDFSHLFSNLTTLQWDSPLSFSQHAFLLCLRSDFCLFKSFKCWKKMTIWKCMFWDEWLNCLEQLESMKMMPSAAFTFIFILLQQLSFYFLFHQKSALTHKCKDRQRAVLLISSEHRPLWAGRVSENEMRKSIFTLISLCIFIFTATQTMSSQRKISLIVYTAFKWCLIMEKQMQ